MAIFIYVFINKRSISWRTQWNIMDLAISQLKMLISHEAQNIEIIQKSNKLNCLTI